MRTTTHTDLTELIWLMREAANLVLQNTIERTFVKDLYSDLDRGTFLVRGENVLLLGEVVRIALGLLQDSSG